MDWHPLSSSTIERIGYDAPTMTLSVEFKHGGAYQYFDVPENVFQELLTAPSPGQYLAQNVKPSYRYARM
jgi:hypothetical protein